MITQSTVNKLVKEWLDHITGLIAVGLGSHHHIPATSTHVLNTIEAELSQQMPVAFQALRDSVLNLHCGLTTTEQKMFKHLPFSAKVIFLVDRYTRPFAAHWLMGQWPDIYITYDYALEVVDDVLCAEFNGTPRYYPGPNIFEERG